VRAALLCVLYDRRRTKPLAPALSMRHVESILETPPEALSFALWYLKQRGYVGNDDKSSIHITVDGMDFLEAHPPAPETVMPFIKPAAISGGQFPVKTAPAAPDGDSQDIMTLASSLK
jgi:hypothetical protein